MDHQKNQRLTVEIEDIGMNGEGIGRVGGYTLFVKDAIPGDLAEVSLTKVKKTYTYARLLRVIESSKDRICAPCPIHRQCGGCQIQALSYEGQLAFKQNKVKNDLIRIGGIDETYLSSILEPIVGMPEKSADKKEIKGRGFRYRNKAQYPIGKSRDGEIIAGFYARRTHSIIQTEDCLLGPKINRLIVDTVIKHMKNCGIPL